MALEVHRHQMDPALMTARQHNDEQPISQIPAEVLGQIFLLHRQSFSTTVSSTTKSYPLFRLEETSSRFRHEEAFSFAAVCHTWHHLAMNHAQLWSTLDFRYYPAKMCVEMAKRAKGCLFDVVLGPPMHSRRWILYPKHEPELLDAIAPLIPRLRDVHWGLRSSLIPEFLKNVVELQREKAHLRTLEIMRVTDNTYTGGVDSFEFPRGILGSAASLSENAGFRSLSSLQLVDVHIDWDALTQDSISCNRSVVQLVLRPNQWRLPSANQLARFIAKFSALRDLQLLTGKYDCICVIPSENVGGPFLRGEEDEVRVKLDNLQRISVTHGSRFHYVLALLQRLILPKTISWDISCAGVFFDADSAGLSELLDMILSRAPFPHVKLRGSGDRGTVTLTGSHPYPSTPTLSLQLYTDGKGGLNFLTFRRVFEELASTYPVNEMKSLAYDYVFRNFEREYIPPFAEAMECANWRRVLQRQGGMLERLVVGSLFGLRCASKVLTDEFDQDETGATETATPSVLAPNLRRFEAKMPRHSEDVKKYEEQVLLSFLEGLVEQRSGAEEDGDDLVVAVYSSGRGDPVRS